MSDTLIQLVGTDDAMQITLWRSDMTVIAQVEPTEDDLKLQPGWYDSDMNPVPDPTADEPRDPEVEADLADWPDKPGA